MSYIYTGGHNGKTVKLVVFSMEDFVDTNGVCIDGWSMYFDGLFDSSKIKRQFYNRQSLMTVVRSRVVLY